MKRRIVLNLMLSVLCALVSAVVVYQAGYSIPLAMLAYSGGGAVLLTLLSLLSARDVVED